MKLIPVLFQYIIVFLSAITVSACICACLYQNSLSGKALYLLAGVLNSVLWLVTFAFHGFHAGTFLFSLALSILLTISIIDIKTLEIPLPLNLLFFVLGIGRLALEQGQMLSRFAGLIGVATLLWLVYAITKGKGIGGGDIKLMAASGLFLGFAGNLMAFFFGCLYAGVVQLVRMKWKGAGNRFAMGPYLSAGILTAIWFGEPVIGWYMDYLAGK